MCLEVGKLFENLKQRGWAIEEINNAELIISHQFRDETNFISESLVNWNLRTEEHIIKRGGGLADQTQELTTLFESKNWRKNTISIQKNISFEHTFPDVLVQDSSTHIIDHLVQNKVGKKVALEIEWNNKDEFYDRDFQAMRRLYEEGIIEAGIIMVIPPKNGCVEN